MLNNVAVGTWVTSIAETDFIQNTLSVACVCGLSSPWISCILSFWPFVSFKALVKCMWPHSHSGLQWLVTVFIKAVTMDAKENLYTSCCVNPNHFTIDPKLKYLPHHLLNGRVSSKDIWIHHDNKWQLRFDIYCAPLLSLLTVINPAEMTDTLLFSITAAQDNMRQICEYIFFDSMTLRLWIKLFPNFFLLFFKHFSQRQSCKFYFRKLKQFDVFPNVSFTRNLVKIYHVFKWKPSYCS